MDSTGAYDIVIPYALNRDLRVEFAPSLYNRLPHPHPPTESSIETTWQAVLKSNPALFNALKFRLSHVTTTLQRATLHIGLTDYKAYQGTHGAPDVLQRFGPKHMARPLGNVVIVQTNDDCTILIVRNQKVGEGKGALAFPGGHPEPGALEPAVVEGEGQRVRDELFEGARREVLEELFLDESHVQTAGDIVCLGVVQRRRDGKASQVFYARVYLKAEEVKERYKQRNVGMEESISLIIMPIGQLEQVAKEGEVGGVPGVAELTGGAELYVQMMRLAPQ